MSLRDLTTFVTFGTPSFSQARSRYVRSLRKFGCANILDFETESDPIKKARLENPQHFEMSRGYGYWIWKPYVIEEALRQAKPNSLVFYTDIATEMKASPEPLLELAMVYDVTTFRVGGGVRQRRQTKREAFVLMGCDTPEYLDDEQVAGGYIIVKNNDYGRHFIRELRLALQDIRLLKDESTISQPEYPEFKFHRQDQSILSILATRHKLPILVDPTQFGRFHDRRAQMQPGSPRFVPHDYGWIFNHHWQRNRPLLIRVERSVRDYLFPFGKLDRTGHLDKF